MNNQADTLRILNSFNYLCLDKVENAKQELYEVQTKKLEYKKVELLDIIKKNLPLPYKKRRTAIICSLFPGGGYFYTGYTQTGISALLLNSILGYVTYNSFKNERVGTGIVFGIFTASFYFGSYYGSLQTVDKYNIHLKKQFKYKLKM
jgi:hypothetical protein